MTTEELYSYEAFRKKYQDDVRPAPRATLTALDQTLVEEYIIRLKKEKKNLSALPDGDICELMSITRDSQVTLSALLLFGRYPQAYFPQLCITAVALPGNEMGEVGKAGERFLDNQRIEGTIPEMLDQAITFVRKNIRIKTIINPATGKREDRTDYPVAAVREAILNTLVHRDYSVHTEGMPIQIVIYPDRIVITNPGGIYGRLRVDQLGKMQPDTRNPVLARALETLGITENRYSGIPTIRRAMAAYGLREPVFLDERGRFTVILYNRMAPDAALPDMKLSEKDKALLRFMNIPRSRQEVIAFLGLQSPTYAMQTYVNPLIEKGLVRLSIPDKPSSQNQRFVCAETAEEKFKKNESRN